MFLLLLSVAASFTLLSGSNVTQTPADIIDSVGRSATISCSHTIKTYDQILWYRQRGIDMQLIGYLYYQTVTIEPGQEDVKIEGSGQANKMCNMIIPELRLNSSAVYFCAASYHGAARMNIKDDFKVGCATLSRCRFKASSDKRWLREEGESWGGFCGSSPSLCSYDQAFFGAGTKLTVLEPNAKITPPKVTLFPPSDRECTKDKEAKKKTLVCAATDFYPDHVRVAWLVDGEKRETGVATDPEAQRRGVGYRITSRLRVPAHEWYRGNRKFTCIVTFFNGKTYDDYPQHISGREGSAEGEPSRESFLRLTQSAKLSYGVLIAKSAVYAAFVAFLLRRLRVSSGKNR
ncbi:T cell receptor beta chain MC.7.G5-like [Vanacampus margaritifer]